MARDEAYRRAEQKIEEARRSGAKILDLAAWRQDTPTLTEVPESLGQLTQLQILDLNGNRLTALPESLGQLTQLRQMNLSHNLLTATQGGEDQPRQASARTADGPERGRDTRH